MSETLVQLKQGLGFLATIGSTAPFVGLFGTVAGIINAFRNIAATGSGGMSVVSGGIAEALVTTALGIFVAIPAVAAFNYFTGRIENFHIEMNRASTQLVNRLFKAPQIDRRRQDVGGLEGERRMRLGEGAKMQASINVTPLVDVVLVLLIIFMVMAPQMRKGPEVRLPKTEKPSSAGRRERPDSGLHR